MFDARCVGGEALIGRQPSEAKDLTARFELAVVADGQHELAVAPIGTDERIGVEQPGGQAALALDETTYAELRAGARRIAAQFRRRGIENGERIVIYAENGHGFIYAYLGALYAGLQLSNAIAIAGRVEYLEDVGALFSGTSQYLKEETFTLDYRPVHGFLVRGELRDDQSNRHYFYSDTIGVYKSSQPTVGVGLVWWFGQKQGAW